MSHAREDSSLLPRIEHEYSSSSSNLPPFVRRLTRRIAKSLLVVMLVMYTLRVFLLHTTINDDDVNDVEEFSETDRFDYIIVGGGPSGIILAVLLSGYLPNNSDDARSNVAGDKKVLLLEAGTHSQASLQQLVIDSKRNILNSSNNDNDLISQFPALTEFDIPLLWSAVASNTDYQWQIGRDGDSESINPRVAKLLGGCGIHNAMLYVRATPQDFERWGLKSVGWAWNNMNNYYHRMSRFLTPAKPSEVSDNERRLLRSIDPLLIACANNSISRCRSIFGASPGLRRARLTKSRSISVTTGE